jgi:2,4-diketo-3-deoxy-L-fuconate hydrolase
LKIVRHGERGAERPGLVDPGGVLRDLSAVLPDWSPDNLGSAALARVAALDTCSLPALDPATRLGVPISRISKMIAIGMNYTDFAAAVRRPHPLEPVMFTKAISCITGPSDTVMLPRASTKTDWEVELGVVIGKTTRYVEQAHALEHVAGYTLVDDISERALQNERGGTWDKGKGCDTFGPVGPWVVTTDEIPDPQDVDLWHEVNGVRYQDGNTRNMIFAVAELLSYISTFVTLEPGDILATGTPAGAGSILEPEPKFFKPGDTMRLGSSKLGVQQHVVEAWRRI